MNPFRIIIQNHLCIALLLFATTTAFPTAETPTQTQTTPKSTSTSEEVFFVETSPTKESKQSKPSNGSSISTTSSLLFKDKKPILTYLLGQPKKQGGVSSPAQLLSPDRYEFFTFDDDGQIVKKLMSVAEIQKIIANNEKGALGEHGSPIEYYQILSVTPDVESIPSVSRINPNEPLFSIHDVIASVQNVLKSEIKMKQSQSSSQNNTNYVASASSEHFEIVTETPSKPFNAETQKVTSSISQQTTARPPSTFTIKQQSSGKPVTAGLQDSAFTFIQETVVTTDSSATIKAQPVESTATQVPTSFAASSATHKVPVDSALLETLSVASSNNRIPEGSFSIPVVESKPLSLTDAHPGLISNETFLDMKPFTVEQVSRIAEPSRQEIKPNPTQLPANFIKIETLAPSQQAKPVKTFTSESSTSRIEIPITPDLAESVSSVLSQIASEISLMENVSGATESIATSAETKQAENTQGGDVTDYTLKFSSSVSTTELPAQSRSTEKLSENPLTVLENILRPQNRPRPFQKIPLIEKGTPDAVELRTEAFTTGAPNYDPVPSPSSTVVILTQEETTPESDKFSPSLANGTDFSTTAAPQSFVVSVSPDAVVQSPEHLKPVTDKVMVSNLNNTKHNQSQLTIEGVHVVQEGNIGQIPRTTEFPGQVVKEVQRMEVPDSGIAEESLSDSASNTFTTQLPYITPEVTTVLEKIEEKTEISEKQEFVEPTEVSLEPLESKHAVTEDIKEPSASDRIDITFVPMLIKTPSVYKQEQQEENQTEAKEEVFTTEKATNENYTEAEAVVTEEEVTVTSNPEDQDNLESKELPESGQELQSEVTTTETIKKESVAADDFSDDSDLIGTLKQNIPNKPYFGKPSKPVYVKPAKVKPSGTVKPFIREPTKDSENKKPYENHLQSSPSVLELDAAPDENLGLEATTVNLDGDVRRFADLCNELAFSLWSSVTHNGLSFVRSVVVSPFAVTSLLAMVFLGARGPTSGQMNDILKLDDMVTFNPHLVFRNVTESLIISRNPGVATTAFVRELYSDKSKGKLLDFYKERAQQFYDGHVEEVNFKTIGDTLRRQTNHLVKRQTWGKITDFLRGSNLMPRPPLAAFSANIFQTDCTRASTKDRDGEMYFVILPASRLRRLVPIPAVVWRDSFLAGYEPNLDATAVSISPQDSAVSTIFVLPGQQGLIAPGDTLARLEHHLLGSSYKKGHWSRLMRSLLPRPGLELQIPRMSHKSVINVTSSLQRMGLKDLFNADKADLTGLNGLANDLHLSDMLQVNLFSTCGEEPIGSRHHSEVYPATPILRREKSSDNVFSESVDNLFAVSDFEDPAISALPLELRPRQARVPLSSPGVRSPEPPRLRFDRPFLFFVRHNPTGLILHMGRFNPRLMP